MSVHRVGLLVGMMWMLSCLRADRPKAMAEEPDPVELTSSPTASLTITKAAEPLAEGDDTVFTFDGGTLGAFTLGDDESVTFAGLAPGDYTVSEVLPTGWVFDGVTCLAWSRWCRWPL